MTDDLRSLDQVRPEDVSLVGGKGLSLAILAAAGLPVPPGFCITTAAHRRLRGRRLADDPGLIAALAEAYHRLGGGLVAVRSSAPSTREPSSAPAAAPMMIQTRLGSGMGSPWPARSRWKKA